jgi:glycosyltransferase involved in cell wall biosynthesis
MYRLRNLANWRCSTHAGPFLTEPVIAALREARQRVSGEVTWVDRSYVAEAAQRAGFENLTVDIDDLLTACHWRAVKQFGWRPSLLQLYVEGLKLAWYERSLPNRFPRLVVCKEEDRAFLGNRRRNIFVVPNGAELAPPADPSLREPGCMLFVAALDYEPNIDALSYFARDILPRIRQNTSAARLLMVGRSPDERSLRFADGASLEILGNVPSVEPYYERASVVVCPIRLGSGTKLKVLEALARGKALVATTAAVEGLDLRPGVDFELADDPQEFASLCCELLRDEERCARLGQAGRERVAARFQWEQIATLAEKALGDPRADTGVPILSGA